MELPQPPLPPVAGELKVRLEAWSRGEDGYDSTLGIIPSGFVKIVVENCPFTVDLPIKSGDFSIAMYQRV